MFWWQLFLWVATTILGELLRPKPKFDTPAPSSIGDFKLPTAEESRSIPVCWGTCKVYPNVVWYGGLDVGPITKKVKTGLFSKSTVVTGYRYYMTVHFTICHGILGTSGREGEISTTNFKVAFDDRVPSQSIAAAANSGLDPIVRGFGVEVELSDPQPEKYQVTIDGENLFGGQDKEGGVSGVMDIYPGGQWHVENDLLQGFLGADIPAFRGIAHGVIRGMYIGNSSYPKPPAIVLTRCPSPKLFLEADDSIDPNAQIGSDANPAYIILEILTNNLWGLGIPAALIDLDSFYNVAEALRIEALGMSYQLQSATEASAVINDVLRHIDAVMYSDVETGLITLKIARKDYDVDEIPVFDKSNIVSCDFTRGSWSETKNNIKVTYIEGLREHIDEDVILQVDAEAGDYEDISTYEVPAAASGTPTVTDGYIVLGPSNENIAYQGPEYTELTGRAITLQGFCKATPPAGDTCAFFWYTREDNSSASNRTLLFFHPTQPNKIFVRYQAIDKGASTNAVASGVEFHFAIVMENADAASENRLYIDGNLELTWTSDGTPGSDPSPLEYMIVLGQIVGTADASIAFRAVQVKRGELYTGESFTPPESFAAPIQFGGSIKFLERPVQWQNLANIQSRGGEISSDVIPFHGFSNSTNANKIAARVGKTLSYPLAAGKIVVNRQGWQLRPGSVLNLTWEPLGIEDMAVRVTRISYGDLLNGRITIDAVEDIFGLSDTGYAAIPATSWVDPTEDPQPANPERLEEMPYHFIGDDLRFVMTLAARAGSQDQGYQVWSDPAGGTNYSQTNKVDLFVPYGTLTAALDACTDALYAAGFALDNGVDLDRLASVTATERDKGVNLALIIGENGKEFVSWQTVAGNTDGDAATITNVVRGVLDTVPLEHELGAQVWFVSDGYGTTDTEEYPADGTVTAKLLPFNGTGVLDIADATQLTVTVDSRALRPYPPGNVLVNGLDCPDVFILEDVTLTWSHRHRVDQTTDQVIVHQDAGDYTDDPEGDYIVKIYVGGVLKHTYTDYADSTSGYQQGYTFAERVADDADLTKIVRFEITPINDDALEGTTRSVEFYMFDLTTLEDDMPYVPAAAMFPSAASGEGCSNLNRVAMGSGKPDILTLDFDQTTQESAQFVLMAPEGFTGTKVKFRPVWSHAAAASFGTVWGLSAVAFGDDEAQATNFGTPQTSTDSGGTTNDLYIGPESADITIDGPLAAGDLVYFKLTRNPADGSDTLNVDARLHGIVLTWINPEDEAT